MSGTGWVATSFAALSMGMDLLIPRLGRRFLKDCEVYS